MTLESELKRKKESLKFFYQMAQEALDAKDLEQAIEISAKGLEEAELENQKEWAEKFDALKLEVESAKEAPSLNTSVAREDVTIIKGVGKAVAEKLRAVGFDTVKLIADATLAQLTNIPGIGQKTAQKIIEAAKIHISRKSLNNFSEDDHKEEIPPVNPSIEEEKETSQKTSTSRVKFPLFEEKFKVRRLGHSRETKVDSNESYVYEEVDDDSEYGIGDDLAENEEVIGDTVKNLNSYVENPPSSSLDSSIKEDTINFIDRTQGLFRETTVQRNSYQSPKSNKTQILEQLTPSEKKPVMERLIQTLQELNFHIIEKMRLLKDLSMNSDLIALKIVHANEFLDLIFILPIKLNMLKGGLRISNEQVKYIPLDEKFRENGSSFRLLLDSTINDLGKVYNAMRDDLTNEGKLLSFLRKHLQVDISIEKSITKKNLFFRAGPLQYKILIEPILVCNSDVGFLEKLLPFPYLKDINLHIITQQKLQSFITYLEKKYTLYEEHSGQKSSLISYEESFDQFLQNGRKLSLPFIGFGFITLMLVIFQAFPILELVVNIGYALLGIYSTSLAYFYTKFFKTKLEIQTEFTTPYHQKQLKVDDPGLILIGEELTPELMDQFVFECIGKETNSPFIQKIEETHTKKRLEEKVRATKMKNENLFEERDLEENRESVDEDIQREDDEFINKYSSFLED